MDRRYKFQKPHKDLDIQQIQREIQDNLVSFDKDGNIVIDSDIYCKDLITDSESIYLGSKKKKNRLRIVADELHYNDIKLTYSDQDRLLDSTGVGIVAHASIHESGGYDEISHDGLADFVADEHIDWTSTTENIVTTGTIYGKGYRINIVAKTAAYTATAADDVITCGAGNETFTIDLPAALVGKTYYIKNVGSGVITVDADTTGSTTIDGDTTQTINQYECLKVVSDASVYWGI